MWTPSETVPSASRQRLKVGRLVDMSETIFNQMLFNGGKKLLQNHLSCLLSSKIFKPHTISAY